MYNLHVSQNKEQGGDGSHISEQEINMRLLEVSSVIAIHSQRNYRL